MDEDGFRELDYADGDDSARQLADACPTPIYDEEPQERFTRMTLGLRASGATKLRARRLLEGLYQTNDYRLDSFRVYDGSDGSISVEWGDYDSGGRAEIK